MLYCLFIYCTAMHKIIADSNILITKNKHYNISQGPGSKDLKREDHKREQCILESCIVYRHLFMSFQVKLRLSCDVGYWRTCIKGPGDNLQSQATVAHFLLPHSIIFLPFKYKWSLHQVDHLCLLKSILATTCSHITE